MPAPVVVDGQPDAGRLLTGSVARLLHAEALLELGAHLRRRGQAERAVPHPRQAVELSARCESKPLIRRAAEELRGCEPTTAHGTPRTG